MAAERLSGLLPGAPAAWRAASLLGLILAGAVFVFLRGGEDLLAAPCALLAVLGYAGYRYSSRLARLRAALDQFADREIAAQRRWEG